MTLKDDLAENVAEVFRQQWKIREGRAVPEPDDLGLGNEAVTLDGTVLYADLARSTGLVNTKKPHFAAEIYKTYLHCASKIIRSEGGEITAFDGDRIMAVFIGETPNTSAARCAMKITYIVNAVINPAIKNQYPSEDYQIPQCVGIDTSSLFIARTGIRGSNDLVWVGPAANYAAKLATIREQGFTSYITSRVYVKMSEAVKVSDGRRMWECRAWNGMTVYRSSWLWKVE